MSSKKKVITTARFGEIEIRSDSVIDFPRGLIGFSDCKQFVVLEHQHPFAWLQSVDNPNLAFVVLDALELDDSYQLTLPFGDSDLDLKKEDEYTILVLVAISNAAEATVNLKAPIIINLRNNKGGQFIQDDESLSVLTELKKLVFK